MTRIAITPRRSGDRFSVVGDLNRIGQAIDASQVEVRGNGLHTRGPGNSSIFIPQQKTMAALKPFDVIFVPSTTQKLLKLMPGTISGLLPSNIFTPVDYNGSGTEYVKITCSSSTFNITEATVYVDSDTPQVPSPTLSSAPSSFEILIAVLVNGVLFQVTDGNMIARPLISYQIEKASPQPGQPAFDLYYNWEVVAAVAPAAGA